MDAPKTTELTLFFLLAGIPAVNISIKSLFFKLINLAGYFNCQELGAKFHCPKKEWHYTPAPPKPVVLLLKHWISVKFW